MCWDLFYALQENVCRQKKNKYVKGISAVSYTLDIWLWWQKKVMSWFSPRLVLKRKCIWRIHLIKAVLADENWRKNKISASLAKLLLLLLDCFMEDMNLIHFQRQLGNSRQRRKGLPLDFAVFLWMVCTCVKCSQRRFSGHFWGKVSVWGLTHSSVWVIWEPRCLETRWTSSRVAELSVPAVGTSVQKENSLKFPTRVDANCVGETSVFLPMAKVSLIPPWLPPALSWVIRTVLVPPDLLPSLWDWMKAVAELCAVHLFDKVSFIHF